MKQTPSAHRRISSAPQVGINDPLSFLGERQSAAVRPGQKVDTVGCPDDPEMAFGKRGSLPRTFLWGLLIVGIGAIILTALFAFSDLFQPGDDTSTSAVSHSHHSHPALLQAG